MGLLSDNANNINIRYLDASRAMDSKMSVGLNVNGEVFHIYRSSWYYASLVYYDGSKTFLDIQDITVLIQLLSREAQNDKIAREYVEQLHKYLMKVIQMFVDRYDQHL